MSFWLAATGAYAVYFGMTSAELVRGLPREYHEGVMHGGVPVGDSHLTVAVFEAKTGRRIADAEVTAHITGDRGLTVQKRLDLMVIAGSATYGNYFSLPGSGPYRIEVRIRPPGKAREVRQSSPGRGRECGGPNGEIAFLHDAESRDGRVYIRQHEAVAPAKRLPAINTVRYLSLALIRR